MTENDPKYRRPSMPDTYGGRELLKVDGDAGAVGTRADKIVDLGEKMSTAADTLQLFADGDLGIGDSLEKIREQAKEVYADLRTAGQRYTPSGEALKAYSQALQTVQDATDSLVTDAENAWESVNTTSFALLEVQQAQEQHDQEAENKPLARATASPKPSARTLRVSRQPSIRRSPTGRATGETTTPLSRPGRTRTARLATTSRRSTRTVSRTGSGTTRCPLSKGRSRSSRSSASSR